GWDPTCPRAGPGAGPRPKASASAATPPARDAIVTKPGKGPSLDANPLSVMRPIGPISAAPAGAASSMMPWRFSPVGRSGATIPQPAEFTNAHEVAVRASGSTPQLPRAHQCEALLQAASASIEQSSAVTVSTACRRV